MPSARPRAQGKFVWRGGVKLYVRGATYGTFQRDSGARDDYSAFEVVADDFARMAASNFNAVRTYTVPPRYYSILRPSTGLAVSDFLGSSTSRFWMTRGARSIDRGCPEGSGLARGIQRC